MCSCQWRGEHPPRGPGLVLRVGRAARRSAAAGPSGGRRWRASCWPRATRRRPSASRPRCRVGKARRAVPAHDRRAVALRGLFGGEQGGLPDLRRHVARGRGDVDRRGVPRRARDAADRGRAGGDRRAAARARCAREVGLPITVGVARTKFLAKVASGVAKPDGLLLVEPEDELAFLHPLPVEKLWGVGVKTADKLHARGITTVGEVAAAARDRAGRDARARVGPAAARARAQSRSAARHGRACGGARSAASGRSGGAGSRRRPSSSTRCWSG